MMDASVKTDFYPNGELQRWQLVRPEDWSHLEFLPMGYDREALDRFAQIYDQYLIPACPWLFGNLILFHLPEGTDIRLDTTKYGTVADPITAAAAVLEEGVRFRRGAPHFRTGRAKTLWDTLEANNALRIVRGKLPITTVIPVSNAAGFLSRACPGAAMKVNASFFIMDPFDCATVFDHIGTVLGLCVKDGMIRNPPLYHREALLINKDGTTQVTLPDLKTMPIEIAGQTYLHGKNAAVYTRPRHSRVWRPGRKKLVIVGCRVAAVCTGAGIPVPASGFVLCPEGTCNAKPGDPVAYRGMEDVRFGIQVGNSILRNGVKTERFLSRFYNIRALQPVPYPPSLYPLNFRRSRAARIALGADAQGKPMVLWAEGAAKLGHTPGKDSCGASLADMARICAEAGMVNAVNLDGGGSAQILLEGKRFLQISDRNAADLLEAERPVPLGLIIRQEE